MDKESLGEIILFVMVFIAGMVVGFNIMGILFNEEPNFSSLNLTVTSGKDVNDFCESNDYQGGWIATSSKLGIHCYKTYGSITENKVYDLKGCR